MGQISQTEFKHFSDKTYFIISKYLQLKLILLKKIMALISNIFIFLSFYSQMPLNLA